MSFITIKKLLRSEAFPYIFIIVSALGATLLYQALNQAPQRWDSAAHVNLAMLYALKIREARLGEIMTLSGYYPPFVHLIGALFFLIFPFYNSPIFISLIFNIVGIVFVYKIVILQLNNKKSALLACTIFSLIPQVFIETRLFELDLPITVLLLGSLYFLLKSESLAKRRETILFFLFFAFAQLTKWYAFVYIAIPILFALGRALNLKVNFWKLVKNVALGTTVFLALTLPWYIVNLKSISTFYGSVSSIGELNDPQNTLSVNSFLEYLRLITAFQLSFPLFVVIILSAVYLLLKKRKEVLFYLLAIIVPYLMFTLIKNKDVRYAMPLIPYFVLILVTALNTIGARKKRFLEYLTLGYLILLYVFISFNKVERLPSNLSVLSKIYSSPWNTYQWMQTDTASFAYQTTDWQINKMYNLMLDIDKYTEKTGNVLFAVDFPNFNTLDFTTLQLLNRTYYQVTSGYQINDEFTQHFQENAAQFNFEYIITSYNPGVQELTYYPNLVKINRYLQIDNNTTFQSRGFFRLPNGEDVYVFKRV